MSIRTPSSICVTGAAGCIGRNLLERLASAGLRVTGLDLVPQAVGSSTDRWVQGSILNEEDCTRALQGIATVIHLAAKAHSVPRTAEQIEQFWKVNFQGTRTLLGSAAAVGVQRFVHVSTVAVLSPRTKDAVYADSKRAAEEEVLGFRGPMEVVVVRPTTIYGPYDRGNVYKMVRWIERGFPAIVGSGDNLKSLLFSRNLADALLFLSEHGISGQCYTVTDGHDLPLRDVALTISEALGRGNRVSTIPPMAAKFVADVNEKMAGWFGLPKFFGREMMEKLTGESVFDPSALFSLGFVPRYTFKAGMEETVRWYRHTAR